MSERDYPDAPVVGVGAVIWKDDHFLLIQRSKAPMKGGWSIPGGRLELGESLQEGIHREIKEETGLEVRLGPVIDVVDYIAKDEDGHVITHYGLVDYLAFWQDGEASAGSDADAVKWASLEDIKKYNLWDKTREIIEKSAEMISSRV